MVNGGWGSETTELGMLFTLGAMSRYAQRADDAVRRLLVPIYDEIAP